MPRSNLLAGTTLTAWVALLSPAAALAQADAAPGTAPAAGAATAGQAVRVKSLLGSTVGLQGNASAGTVDDVVLSADGVVEYLVVANQGKLYTVPWQAAKFDWAQRTATVGLTAEQWQAVPSFTPQAYPNFYAPAYREQVYKVYGLTPGQERRLERRGNSR